MRIFAQTLSTMRFSDSEIILFVNFSSKRRPIQIGPAVLVFFSQCGHEKSAQKHPWSLNYLLHIIHLMKFQKNIKHLLQSLPIQYRCYKIPDTQQLLPLLILQDLEQTPLLSRYQNVYTNRGTLDIQHTLRY